MLLKAFPFPNMAPDGNVAETVPSMAFTLYFIQLLSSTDTLFNSLKNWIVFQKLKKKWTENCLMRNIFISVNINRFDVATICILIKALQ